MTNQDLNQSTDSVKAESVKSEDSIEAKLTAMFNSPERKEENFVNSNVDSKPSTKESELKPLALPTRRSKRKRTVSGPSSEQIVEKLQSAKREPAAKKSRKRSSTITLKEEEIIVEQPSRRSATLNKSYTEFGDFDENNEDSDVAVVDESDHVSDESGDYSEDRKDFKSPKRKKRFSPKRKKEAKSNNNEPKSNSKSEYFMPGDLILLIGKTNYKNSHLYGIKNMETFDPKEVRMKICVAAKESYYHVKGKKFMTRVFDVGKEAETLQRHELIFKYRESDERIKQYLNYHNDNRGNSNSAKHFEIFRGQLELLQSIEQLELPSSADQERLEYLKGLTPVPKPEQEIIEEVNITSDNEAGEQTKKTAPKKKIQVKPKTVIDYFAKNKKLRKNLKDICEGAKESERHDLFRAKDFYYGFDSPISRLTNMCFLPSISDSDYELLEKAKGILDETSAKFTCEEARNRYCKYVLIPEGIIFYLQNARKMGKEEATTHYLETMNTEVRKEEEKVFDSYVNHQQDIHPVSHDPNDEIPELE